MRALVMFALILGACTPKEAMSSPVPNPTATQAQTSPTPTTPSQSVPTASVPASVPRPSAAPPASCPAQRGGDQATNRAPRTMRAAEHSGYDRVVIDFGAGAIPPYTVEHVDRIVHGGSGLPIQMEGSGFIRVHFVMAGGAGEYPGPRRLLPDTALVREVVFDEFEGATTVGIGLSRVVCPQVETLDAGRLVLDFYH